MSATHLSGPLYVGGVPVFGGIFTTGQSFFVDAVNGSDGNTGSADFPVATLLQAYNLAVENRGDVIYIVSYGDGTTGTARISAAFDWAKDNTHLIGICAPTMISKRARIAETSGTGLVTLMTISAGNCRFENLHWFHGTSDNEDQFCIKHTGLRNYFRNCHIGGMGHATPAGRAGSRTLVMDGGGVQRGETTFEDCVIGLNTIAQTAANAQLEFLSTSARNIFRRCYFIGLNTSGGAAALFVKAGTGSLQDFAIFEDCYFVSLTKQSGAATRTNAMNIASDSGGDVILAGYSAVFGCTDVDAASSSNVWSASGPPTAGTTGLGIVLTH